MKCLLISFFNSHNIGDCMIADSLSKIISNYFDTEKFSYSGDPRIITDINNIKRTNSTTNKSNKKLVYQFLKKMKLDSVISLYRLLKVNEHKYLKEKIREVDLVVIGGGNMIFDIDEHSDSSYKFNKIVSVARKHNKEVFAISLGIGPFKTIIQEKNACEAISKCKYITFRDIKSYNIYAKHIKKLDNVDISIDPVFFLEKYTSTVQKTKQLIGLNLLNSKLINNSEEEVLNHIRSYAALADKLIEDLNINLVLFSTDLSDYEIIDKVYNQMTRKRNAKIQEINGFHDLIGLYNEITLLVGMRMHSMIIAFTQGIPVIGISWQQKVDAFFEIIDSRNSVFNYNNIENSLHKIVDLCKSKIDRFEEEQKRMIRVLNNIKSNRSVDFHILNQIKTNNEINDKR